MPTRGGELDVFVSYSREESHIVDKIVGVLEYADPKLNLFIDRRDIPISQDWRYVLDERVNSARVVLGLLSTQALKRPIVQAECKVGLSRRVFVGALVGPEPKSSDWPKDWPVERPQCVNLKGFDGNLFAQSDFHLLAAELAKRLQNDALEKQAAKMRDWARVGVKGLKTEANQSELWLQLIETALSVEVIDSFDKVVAAEGPIRVALVKRRSELIRKERAARKWKGTTILRGRVVDGDTEAGVTLRDALGLPEMVVVPAGAFKMGPYPDERGSNCKTEGREQREIRLERSFAVARDLLTFAEWDFAARSGLRALDSSVPVDPADRGLARDRYPAFHLSWLDATSYCRWASEFTGESYRLLSEAEWEYCCRAGVYNKRFHFGDELVAGKHANFGSSSRQSVELTPQRQFNPNRFGIYDMHGNLHEWVQDAWQAGLAGVPANGAPRPSGSELYRVIRGGCWKNPMLSLRSAARSYADKKLRDVHIGVRVARDIRADEG